jgi:hypothetical protein
LVYSSDMHGHNFVSCSDHSERVVSVLVLDDLQTSSLANHESLFNSFNCTGPSGGLDLGAAEWSPLVRQVLTRTIFLGFTLDLLSAGSTHSVAAAQVGPLTSASTTTEGKTDSSISRVATLGSDSPHERSTWRQRGAWPSHSDGALDAMYLQVCVICTRNVRAIIVTSCILCVDVPTRDLKSLCLVLGLTMVWFGFGLSKVASISTPHLVLTSLGAISFESARFRLCNAAFVQVGRGL